MRLTAALLCVALLAFPPAVTGQGQAGDGASAPAGAGPLPPAVETEPPLAPGTTRVETRDGRTVTGRWTGQADGALALQTDAGPVSLPLADVVLLAQAPAEPVPAASGDDGALLPAPDLVVLAGPHRGDRLVGRLLGGDDFGLRFQLEGGPPVEIPFESLERLLPHATGPIDRLALLPGGGADDRLWRIGKDGAPDSLTGVVQRVRDSQVVFEGALGTLDFDLAEVLALVFAADPGERPEPPGTPVVVRLRDGSRLHAGLLEVAGGRVALATGFAARLELPQEAVVSLVHRGDDVALLADLAPVAVEEWPTLGTPADFLFPWRADLSVTGQLLAVGGVPRASGLGVHAHARLAFTLPEGTAALRVTAGLCDEVAELPATGSVVFELRVDGALRASSGLHREGDPPCVLRVGGLRGGERLELLVTDGGDDDAGDRAGWVDGLLLLGAR